MTLTDRFAGPLLPSTGLLSDGQVRGRNCVFCDITLSANAVTLGAHDIHFLGAVVQWFPRSCRPCDAGGYADSLLGAAFSACRDLPPPEQLLDLYLRLRHEVRRRLPTVEQAAATAGQGTMSYHAHQRIVDAATDALLDTVGDDNPSPLVLAMRCSELGRRLRDLIPYQPCVQ
ncbi:DUF6415 family natural product biosynthesis protein [Streptomyces sp. NPDC020607]|uniref:DUF6415 family natural product biosynthesis protein n=1 Tax=Streptomyces sp. NPDC020607 TaxID=3365082 RepID=UPI0037AA5813